MTLLGRRRTAKRFARRWEQAIASYRTHHDPCPGSGEPAFWDGARSVNCMTCGTDTPYDIPAPGGHPIAAPHPRNTP